VAVLTVAMLTLANCTPVAPTSRRGLSTTVPLATNGHATSSTPYDTPRQGGRLSDTRAWPYASGLNLLVTAIILWNTRYLERAVAALREVEEVPDRLLLHLSPLGWEHVNLTGDYVWAGPEQVTENHDGLLPLRITPNRLPKAA
jgi:hypothetical protein